MKKTIICTLCPAGCEIDADYTCRDDIEIRGNSCEKGYEYAIDECFDPRRTFTGNISVSGNRRRRIPVRSDRAIPRDKMMDCANLLKEIHLEAPIESGYIVIRNVLDTGADITTCMEIRREE